MNNGYLKLNIKSILSKHEGHPQAIKGRLLLDLLNMDGRRVSDRKMRLTIHELIDEGLPILSFPDEPAGYCLPANREELDSALAILDSYIIDLAERKRHLEKAGALYLRPACQRRLL